jgi:hypothetical protein
MTPAAATKTHHRSDPAPAVLLGLGIVAPPVLWIVQLFTLFMLEDVIACAPATRAKGLVLGIGIRPAALTVTAVLALATLGAGVMSSVLLARLRRRDGSDAAERARWMATAGIMNSVLFLSVIVVKIAGPLMIGACRAPV